MSQPVAKSAEPQSVRIARLMGLADPESVSDAVLARTVARGVPFVSAGAKTLPERRRIGVGSLIARMVTGRYQSPDSDESEDWTISVGKIGPVSAVHFEQTLSSRLDAIEVLTRQESERLYEVSRVYDAALRAFGGNAEKADGFLSRAHPLLDGEVPLELAQVSSAGADAVVNLIGRAVAGVAI